MNNLTSIILTLEKLYLNQASENNQKANIKTQEQMLHDKNVKEAVAFIEKTFIPGTHVDDVGYSDLLNPLLYLAAIYDENIPVARALIARGANINVRNDWGLTPLHIASMNGQVEMLKLFISLKADVNDTKNIYKMSPLERAASAGHAEVVRLLYEAGAQLNIGSIRYLEPISGSIRTGLSHFSPEMQKVLLNLKSQDKKAVAETATAAAGSAAAPVSAATAPAKPKK